MSKCVWRAREYLIFSFTKPVSILPPAHARPRAWYLGCQQHRPLPHLPATAPPQSPPRTPAHARPPALTPSHARVNAHTLACTPPPAHLCHGPLPPARLHHARPLPPPPAHPRPPSNTPAHARPPSFSRAHPRPQENILAAHAQNILRTTHRVTRTTHHARAMGGRAITTCDSLSIMA
jgi:hypothetical protein